MVKSSYRFDGSSFTGQKYAYVGPSSAPCRKVNPLGGIEMISKDDWQISVDSTYTYAVGGLRGIIGGSNYPVPSSTISYISLESESNSHAFGNLSVTRNYFAACSSNSRSIFGGGAYTPTTDFNLVDYVTISTLGNASTFGDLTEARMSLSACSNDVYGLFSGGTQTYEGGKYNVIESITIASLGNASSVGELSVNTWDHSSCSSPTRAIFSGGLVTGGGVIPVNTISYAEFSSPETTSDFGDLVVTRYWGASCSSNIRGIIVGGESGSPVEPTDKIDYITIATTGNASNFGNLTRTMNSAGACSSKIYGVFTKETDMDYINIATTGNAQNFGDATISYAGASGCSDCHGGLA
jgi:hypothetical protein